MQIGKIYKRILDHIRSTDFVTTKIYGIRIANKINPITWDLTTLNLKKVIDAYHRRETRNNLEILDMGCGQIALLGLYLKKLFRDSRVLSVDIYDEFIENARQTAKANDLDIELLQSDLFNRIHTRFDVITFNPPYVPFGFDRHDLSHDKIRFSGINGTDLMKQFLKECGAHLKSDGVVFLGINCFYIPESTCKELIEQSGFEISYTSRMRLNTSRVFKIHPIKEVRL